MRPYLLIERDSVSYVVDRHPPPNFVRHSCEYEFRPTDLNLQPFDPLFDFLGPNQRFAVRLDAYAARAGDPVARDALPYVVRETTYMLVVRPALRSKRERRHEARRGTRGRRDARRIARATREKKVVPNVGEIRLLLAGQPSKAVALATSAFGRQFGARTR